MAQVISDENIIDIAPDVVESSTLGQLIGGNADAVSTGSQSVTQPVSPTKTIVQVATDYESPNYKEGQTGWKLGSNGVIEAVGIKAQTASTVGTGSNGVVLDENGLRGYNATLGQVFNLPTDGTAPTFSGGSITESTFEINTNAVLRTSSTVADGTASSAGVLINNTGVYGLGASQTTNDANVRIKIDGTLYAGNATNYLSWDGTYLRLKGSLDVGTAGVLNNSVYTVANLPVPPTTVGFNPPSATDADYSAVLVDSYSESNQDTGTNLYASGQSSAFGQTFNNTSASLLDSCKFYLKKTGSPTGNSYAKIYAATLSGGYYKPTGAVLATSDAFSVAGLTTSYVLTTLTFSGAERIALSASTKYVVIFEYTTGGSSVNYVTVGMDGSSPTHTFNASVFLGLGVDDWVELYAYDCCFYVYTKLGNFTNPSNAYTSNNVYASAAATSGDLVVDLSTDGGSTWTSTLTKTFTGSDSTLTYGTGSTELWGRSWTRADMVDANFRVRVTHGNYSQIYKTFGFTTGTDTLTGVEVSIEANYATSTLSIDLVNVKIYYGSTTVPVQAGSQAFASNGRKNGEGAGAGTGVLVFHDGTAWRACDTGATVAA